jgi:hypothetical protein
MPFASLQIGLTMLPCLLLLLHPCRNSKQARRSRTNIPPGGNLKKNLSFTQTPPPKPYMMDSTPKIFLETTHSFEKHVSASSTLTKQIGNSFFSKAYFIFIFPNYMGMLTQYGE